MIRRLLLELEDRRISSHLKAVERLLLARTDSVTGDIRRKRLAMIDRLETYRRGRVFPRNRTGSLMTSIFVDSGGRECAVGHLIGADSEVTRLIADSQNLARVPKIDDEELQDWQRKSGLTVEELSLVQPQYATVGWFVDSVVPGLLALFVGIVGAWISHGARRWRFRFGISRIGGLTIVFSLLAGSAGWSLATQAASWWTHYSGQPRFMLDVPGIGFEAALGTTFAIGFAAILFGVSIAVAEAGQFLLRRLSRLQVFGPVVGLAARVAEATIGFTGALVWALGVIYFGRLLFSAGHLYPIGFGLAFVPLLRVIWTYIGNRGVHVTAGPPQL